MKAQKPTIKSQQLQNLLFQVFYPLENSFWKIKMPLESKL